MFGIPPGNQWLDRPLPQRLPMGVRVVTSIGVESLGATTRAAKLAAHGWNSIKDGKQLRDIVSIGRRQGSSEGKAVRIRNQVVFRARFGPIGGIGTGFFAPKTARTDALSTAERDQSIWLAAWSLASSTACNFCQTPACSHSFKRLQQVIPDPQPISCGKSSHGMPVFSTNRIPVSALRWSKGLRPGFFFRRGFTGINGSIISHKVSSTSSLVIPQA
jgi:hypothetical protein